MLAGKIDDRGDFPIVAIFVFVDPRADRCFDAKLAGDARYQFDAFGRRIGSHRFGQRCQNRHVSSDLFGLRRAPSLRVGRAVKWSVRYARQRPFDPWSGGFAPEQRPKPGVKTHDTHDHSCKRAHGGESKVNDGTK